jgi:hypothetical protein
MANDTTPCNIEQVNNAFVLAPKYIHMQISNKIRAAKTLWTNLIKREGFEYGQGYIKYSETFHGGVGVQDGGASWDSMSDYRAPLTNGPDDPGFDPCRSQALIVGTGLEEKQYSIYQTERRTGDICLTSVLFKWQLEQTLGLKLKALAEITTQEWEQILQAIYLNFCNKRFATNDASDSLGMSLKNLTVTPASGSVFGGSIAVPVGGVGSIGPLSTTLLDRLYPYLSRQCFEGALAMNEGAPVFGVSASQESIRGMLHNDAAEVEALKWAMPEVNIEGYGKMRTYKNFAQHNDWNAERYDLSTDGTKLERVYPWKSTPTTLDNALNVDPAYLKAPFEMVKILVRDVYTAQVPAANPSSIAGGYTFDPADNVMDFQWMNIQERCENPRREKGFFLGRARVAPKPGDFSGDALAILVRRCNDTLETGCTTCSTANTASTAVTTAAFYTVGDAYATATKYILQGLASCFSVQVGNRVTIAYTSNGGASGILGVVADNSDPQNIVVILDSAYTTRDLTAQTGITVASTTTVHP